MPARAAIYGSKIVRFRPTATITVADEQDKSAVSLSLGGTSDPECPVQSITSGSWTVRDGSDDLVDSGSALPGADVIVDLTGTSGPYTATYQVIDTCAKSLVASVEFNAYSREVFQYTGADQLWTVPEFTSKLRIKAWAGSGATGENGHAGIGGFTEIIVNAGNGLLTPGTQHSVMVGQQGGFTRAPNNGSPVIGVGAYGFGGRAACRGGGSDNVAGAGGGGGLSGIFTGTDPILETDAARALLIAGGGGGAGSGPGNSPSPNYAYPGNFPEPNVGGMPTMKGEDRNSGSEDRGYAGGGGGYEGGSAIGYPSYGGKGFAHPSADESLMLNQDYQVYDAVNQSDPDWFENIGGYNSPWSTAFTTTFWTEANPEKHGLVVIMWD